MGYQVELNTLLRPPADFDFASLAIGQRYIVMLERERIFPLHIAILLVDKDWNFYGYAVAHAMRVVDRKSTIEFEMLTLFTLQEQQVYRQKFIEAGKITGEVM